MSDIERALTRKFGPLPAWAWAAIFAGAMFLYRRGGLGLTSSAAATGTGTSATSPSITDGTGGGGGGDPQTLDPGQSVYDPNTGQLLGTAPEQQIPNVPDAQSPVTLEPGESVYDPNTGAYYGGTRSTTDGAAAGTKPASKAPAKRKKKKATTKRTHKAKPQHSNKHRKISAHRPGQKSKPRGHAKLQSTHHTKQMTHAKDSHPAKATRQGSTRPVSMKPHSTIRTRAASVAKAASLPRASRAVAARVTAPALRQRPAAPRVVMGQRVQTHPARPAATPTRMAVIPRPAAGAPRSAPRPAARPAPHPARRRH